MDLVSNFSIFGVRRFTESPGPLHWIAFPVEILTKPLIHWIPPPSSLKTLSFHWKVLRRIPCPKIGSEDSDSRSKSRHIPAMPCLKRCLTSSFCLGHPKDGVRDIPTSGSLMRRKHKRATTNVQNRFVQFFLLSFLIFCSPWAKTLCFEGGKSRGEKLWKSVKNCEKVWKIMKRFCPLVVAL